MELKTSDKWAEIYKDDFVILDADGWDRTNFQNQHLNYVL